MDETNNVQNNNKIIGICGASGKQGQSVLNAMLSNNE